MNTLGENIRILRKMNGNESQSKLAEEIYTTQQAISKIEKGNETSFDMLKHIANYYNISIEDLVESNLKIDFNEYNLALFNEFYDVLFPVIVSEDVLKDEDFRKGYEYFGFIKKEAIKNVTISSDLIDTCWNLFLKSWKKNKRPETAANLLSLNMMIFSSILETDEVKYIDSLNETMKKGKVTEKIIREESYTDFIQNRVIKNINLNEEKNKIKIKFIEDNEDNVEEYIMFLKSTLEWNPLGDYFCALRYFVGMVDNDKTIAFNMELGEEWMSSLLGLGNKYAIDFFAVLLKFFGYTIIKNND